MSSINSNPLSDDSKNKRGVGQSTHPLNKWVEILINNTSDDLKPRVYTIHDMTVNNLYNLTGNFINDGGAEYQTVFGSLLDSLGLRIENESVVVKVARQQIVKPVQQTRPELPERYEVYNPLNAMKFKFEEAQYRRNRKKINFVNNKSLFNLITQEDENPKDLYPVSIRKGVSSDPSKDKELLVTNVIYNLLVGLDALASPSSKERRSEQVDAFYYELINDFNRTVVDGGVYDLKKLIRLIENLQEEVKKEIDALYFKVYEKVGLPKPNKLSKRKRVKVGINQEPYQIRELHRHNDSDLVKLYQKIEYFDLLNIIDK